MGKAAVPIVDEPPPDLAEEYSTPEVDSPPERPELVGLDGASEEDISELDELAKQSFAGPGEIPTREEIKARIEDGLASGLLTERQIIADIYASQYSCELMLRQLGGFLDNLAGSKLGARLMGGGARKARKQ